MRARPAATRAWAGRFVTSAPLKRMRPLSVGSAPEIWPMSVVLPAPFGPMSACTWPRTISSVTSSVATTPPKRLLTPRSSSMASSSFRPGKEAGDAFRRKHDDGEEHDADREAGVVLVVRRELREPGDAVVGDEVLEAEQHRRADHAAPEPAHAPQDHHDHQRSGLDPMQEARAHVARLVGDQSTGQSAGGAGNHEAQQLVAIDREADRLGTRLVVADGVDYPSEARMHEALHRVEDGSEDGENHVVPHDVVTERAEADGGAPGHLQAVVAAIGLQ